MSDIKQVIVMRNDLNMRKGKMIAQGAHAAMMFLTSRLPLKMGFEEIGGDYDMGETMTLSVSDEEKEWIIGSFKKVCLYVNSEAELLDIERRAKAKGLQCYVVTDSGLTEFNGVPTKTCLAIGPAASNKIDEVTGNLRLL